MCRKEKHFLRMEGNEMSMKNFEKEEERRNAYEYMTVSRDGLNEKV